MKDDKRERLKTTGSNITGNAGSLAGMGTIRGQCEQENTRTLGPGAAVYADTHANQAKTPGIIEQLKGFEKTLAYEGDLIDQVYGRLSPILRPEDANGKAGSNAIVPQPSPLSEDLRMLQTRAGMNIARLTELLALIDL